MKQVIAHIQEKIEINPGIFYIAVNAPEIAATAQPGQFVMIDCGDNTILRRPISIHRVLDKHKIILLIRIAGTGTRNLAGIKSGDTLNLTGPLGNGFTLSEKTESVLLVSGGMGIAPLVFLAEKAKSLNKKVTILAGFIDSSQLYPEGMLPGGIEFVTATEDGSKGKKGLVTGFLPELLNNYGQVFACGPVNMYRTIDSILDSMNYSKDLQVSLEVRMGCGFGICYGCTIKTTEGLKQVCKDGPVFNIKHINWEWVKV
jgi:dihydroorotate dehydrogenase electron transfer subunit